MTADANLYTRGVQLYSAGNYAEAEACFRNCLEQQPDNPDLCNALGSALEAQGHLDGAAEQFINACRLQPASAVFHYNFANLLRRRQEYQLAETEYLAALAADPELAEALHGLGSLYLEEGRLDAAEACLDKAVRCAPGLAAALYDLGNLQERKGGLSAAEGWYRRCLQVAPAFVPVLNALGMLLLRRNCVDEARRCFEQALDLDPAYLQASCNMAVLDTWCGRLGEAIAALRQAVLQAPEDGDIHFNLALALLTAGHMAEGWREFEWRFRKAKPVALRHHALLRWDGQPLAGKRLLLHAEQGYGDVLQFIRYAPYLKARGASVIVEAQDALIAPLLATVPGVAQVFCRGDVVPDADYQLPVMSLPFALGRESWPPPAASYLAPSGEASAIWRERIGQLPGYKVGLAWAGRPEHENNANRSVPVHLLAPFATVPEATFISLQFGVPLPPDLPLLLHDFAADVSDFTDSAALISCLDLVVTIDSAVAHLAGALGVPVLLLLPWNVDWRWMRERSDSPWYPSMRLYRQTVAGDWSQPIDDVVKELRLSGACVQMTRTADGLSGKADDELIPGGGGETMQRDFNSLSIFLDKIEADVYPEAPSQIHTEITAVALQRLVQLFPLQSGMRVLDVGCGQGPALEFFRDRQMDYLGVTLSDEDVAACRAQGFAVARMDQSFLAIDDQSQDIVWARHVIEHSIFPLFTLHGFNRILRPGGLLYLEVPAPETACHHECNPNHYSVLGKGAWRSLLERSGFKLLGDVEYTFEVLAGPDLYWGFYCVKSAMDGAGDQ